MRTKKIAAMLTAVAVLVVPSIACAGWYGAVHGGGGGDAKSAVYGVEGGYYSTERPTNYMIALGVTGTTNRDEEPWNTVDVRAPAGATVAASQTVRKSEEAGPYLKVGIEPIRGSGFFLFAVGGFTVGDEADLAEVNYGFSSLWYEQDVRHKVYGQYGGGAAYFRSIGKYGVNLQVEYNNRGGVMGSLGIAF